jgi:hypothetical protein
MRCVSTSRVALALVATAFALAGCGGIELSGWNMFDKSSDPYKVDPNKYPIEYKNELLKFLRTDLPDPTNIRGAFLTDPTLSQFGNAAKRESRSSTARRSTRSATRPRKNAARPSIARSRSSKLSSASTRGNRCHCEAPRRGDEAIQSVTCLPGLLRRFAPRNDDYYTSRTFLSGRLRTGLPVAAKMALSTAGVTTQMVGSPTPPQKS